MEDKDKNRTPKKDGAASSSDIFQQLEVPYKQTKEEIWQQLSKRTKIKAAPTPTHSIRRRWYQIAAAAAVILLSGLSFVRFYTANIHCMAGQHLAHTLPDGSEVTLNAASTLTYKPYWWDRKVQLEGEAFFSVEKGQKFTVFSPKGETTVLGTSFNIFARKEDYRILCRTGKVKVQVGEQAVILQPNELAVLEGQTLNKNHTPKSTQILSWQENKFYFDAMLLPTVLEELERQYKVTIVSSVALNTRYTGYFEKSQEVEKTLSLICTTLGLQFKLENNTYKIVSN